MELLRRAIEGEPDSWSLLVRRLMPVVQARVRRFVERKGGRRRGDDGEDLVQDVWLALLADDARRLQAFDARRGASLEGFVGLLAEREVVQAWRRQGAKKRGGHLRSVSIEPRVDQEGGATVPLVDPGPSPEATAEAADLEQRLGRHLAEVLPDRGRLVFRLVFEDGLEPPEAANVLGVKVQVVYNWQYKIRQSARAFLEQARQGSSKLETSGATPTTSSETPPPTKMT